ncbi:hypothetical protein IWZ03DRAFT_360763 [Phyllosticta citriasiana]|uniref:Uncharacterized protein n=1 Tax=Phyllosticta citriasiana TaxID=595635 RepID=A0ABR1KNN2_9PEZI
MCMHFEKNLILAPVQPLWWNKLIGTNAERVEDLATAIAHGVQTAGLLEIPNGESFTIEDITRTTNVITSSSHCKRGGIYIQLYTEVEGYTAHEVFLYVDRTKDFSEHVEAIEALSNKSPLLQGDFPYEIARKSKKRLFFFVCLFESYDKELLVTKGKQTRSLIDHDLYEMVEKASNYSDELPAKLLTRLTDYVLQSQPEIFQWPWTFQWPRACQRQPFGIVTGLNVRSPFTESGSLFDADLWSCDSFVNLELGEVLQFATLFGREIQKQEKPFEWTMRGIQASGKSYEIKISFDARNFPEEPTQAQLILDFLEPGKTHPLSFACLPEVGPFSDWHNANSFDCRLVWNVKDTRFIQNAQRQPSLITMTDVRTVCNPGAGSLIDYAEAIAMWRYFHRVIPDQLHDWDIVLGLCRVRGRASGMFNRNRWLTSELGPDFNMSTDNSVKDTFTICLAGAPGLAKRQV